MWSPRELAELADTSRRAVRHYDEIGLLPDPDRQSNGYGRYGVRHLIRLLRIRRLSGLGLTLPQIAALGEAERPPPSLVRALDLELSGRMAELARARAELAEMLRRPGPVELPSGVAHRVEGLPAAEQALVVVLSRVLDEAALDAYVGLLAPYRRHGSVTGFDQLCEEADGAARAELTDGLSRHYERFRSQHTAEIALVQDGLRRGGPSRQQTVDEAVRELYNPVQRDVLARVRAGQPCQAGAAHRPGVARRRAPRSMTAA